MLFSTMSNSANSLGKSYEEAVESQLEQLDTGDRILYRHRAQCSVRLTELLC